MQRFILNRLGHSLIALWVVSVTVFALIRITGSPVDVLTPPECNQECRQGLEEYWGFNDSLIQQYLSYMGNMFRGNFGDSFRYRGVTTKELIAQRLPNTLKLAGFALLITVVIAVPAGVMAAVKRDTPLDQVAKIGAFLGQASPTFWVGIVLIWIFAVNLHWLPTSGGGGIRHMVLPGITLGLFPVAAIMRLVRSSMLETLDSEYVKLARIKGLPEWKVLWKHCLRNAAIAPVTYLGVIGAAGLTGAVITETVFAWPGVGSLVLEAVLARDFAVVQTVIFLFAGIYIVCNLMVDVLYVYLDPRIRYS